MIHDETCSLAESGVCDCDTKVDELDLLRGRIRKLEREVKALYILTQGYYLE